MWVLGDNPAVDKTAKAISILFHPGFQQFYLVLFYAVKTQQPWIVHLSAVVFLFLVPTAFYLWFKKNVLHEQNIYRMERKDRLWPILVNMLGLLAFTGFAFGFSENTWNEFLANLSGTHPELTVELLSALLIVLNIMAQSVTQFYKISLHMLGTATSGFVFYVESGPVLFALIMLPLIVAVGWSRLHLKGHTPPQVYVGTGAGLAYATVILVLLDKLP